MNTIQDMAPPPAAAPFPGRHRQDTLPVVGPGLTQEAVILRALDAATTATSAVTTAVASGRGGPWAVALLVSIVVSTVTSGALWGAHMLTGDRQILDRLDALEEAQDDREEHDQWVVGALVNLSEQRPLPPPPSPRRRRLGR